MPRYRYEGLKEGEWVEGYLKAANTLDAEQLGMQQDIFIETLVRVDGIKRIPQSEILHFVQGMSTLLKAGLPLKDAATLWMEDAKHIDIWETLFSSVFAGKPLAEGMEESQLFPPYLVAMIHIGEATGRLQNAFEYCVIYLNEKKQLRQTVVSALTYPAMVICVAAIAVTILFVYVMPVFEDMYQRFDAQLPLITRMLLGSMTTLKMYWIPILLAVIIFTGMFHHFSKTRKYHELRDRLVLNMPGVSKFSHQYFDTLICQSLGNLLSSGVGILESLHILTPLVPNLHIQKKMLQAAVLVGRGVSPSSAFEKEELFNHRVRRMIKVGEESGELGEVLIRLGALELETLQNRLKAVTSVLEPLIIVVISIVIGLLLTALYLPMFDIVQAMG